MKWFIVLFTILLLFAVQDSFAQKRRSERAYDAYNAGQYFDAVDEFKNTYSKTKSLIKNRVLNIFS